MSKEPEECVLDPRYVPKMVTKLEKNVKTRITKNGVYNIKPDLDGLECFGGITIEVNVNDNLKTGYNTLVIVDDEQTEPPEEANEIDDVVEEEVIIINENTRTNLQPFSTSNKKLVKNYSIFTNIPTGGGETFDGVLIDWVSGGYVITQNHYEYSTYNHTTGYTCEMTHDYTPKPLYPFNPSPRMIISENTIDLDGFEERFNSYYERLFEESEIPIEYIQGGFACVSFLLEDVNTDSNNQLYCNKLSIVRLVVSSSALTQELRIDGNLPPSIIQTIWDPNSESGTPICEYCGVIQVEEEILAHMSSNFKLFKLNAIQPISETESKVISLPLMEEYIRGTAGYSDEDPPVYFPSPKRKFDLYNASNTKCAELWISNTLEGKFYI